MKARIFFGLAIILGCAAIAAIVKWRFSAEGPAANTNALVVQSEIPPNLADWKQWTPEQRSGFDNRVNAALPLLQGSVPPVQRAGIAKAAGDALDAYLCATPEKYLSMKAVSGLAPSRKLDAAGDPDAIWQQCTRSVSGARWDWANVTIVDATSTRFPYRPQPVTRIGYAVFSSRLVEGSPAKALPDGLGPRVVEVSIPGEFLADDQQRVIGKLVIALSWHAKAGRWVVVGTSLVDVPSGKGLGVPPA